MSTTEVPRRRGLCASLLLLAGASLLAQAGACAKPSEQASADAGVPTAFDAEVAEASCTRAADASLPESCDPASVRTASDPCLGFGLACPFVPIAGLQAACKKPLDFDLCDPARCDVCGDGSDCLAGFEDAPPGLGRCARRCATSASCSKPTFRCADRGAAGKRCVPTPCTRAFAACDIDGKGDGTCLPFGEIDHNLGTLTVTELRCAAGGTTPDDTRCSFTRPQGTGPDLCKLGSICEPSGEASFCRPLCSREGTPRCDGTCFPDGAVLFYGDGQRVGAFGICLHACEAGDGGSGAACPTGEACRLVAEAPGSASACF